MTVTAPRYRIQAFAYAPTTYGIGEMVAEIHPLNLGYADFASDVPQCFFTISKEDPAAALLVAHEGKLHIRVLRWSEQPGYDEVVWAGWLEEHDSTASDTVFYCYGYVSGLFTLLTDWNQEWDNAAVNTIVSDLWTRAKTTLSNSRLAFVNTGVIEAPATESGGSTPIILPTYSVFYKRILFVMQEMAALAASDTTNTPLFQITHSATPTFNFKANIGQDRPNLRWEWGDGIVSGYSVLNQPVFRRNELLAVGSSPRSDLMRLDLGHETDIEYYGRRQEPLYFAWVRDEEELSRVTHIRSRLARQRQIDLALEFFPNGTPPITPSSPMQSLLDRAYVKIDDGIVSIDNWYSIMGVQVLFDGSEKVRVLLRQMYEADPHVFALDTDRMLDDDLVMDAA